jgi:hypothetical protein
MAIRIGYNGQVSRGLIFAFDSADFFNSYRGEPAVNTIPSPQVNSYPTFGNGWASYNTNKYCGNNGCAVYWDIPSIASVSNNIITTNGSHGIYSFDVIRPESTGGGVTAGTDYFAKKISDTQFSLHAYNGSQGGDQGYINPATGGHKVHDSFWLDQRVSVSASGFPTKWWGAPHLPNSGLVKEIIVGGFDLYPSQKTDCMRLHAHRPESADGMSYGPDAVVVPGQVHTYSFWTRALNQQTANAGGSMSNYNYGSVSPTSWGHGYTHGPLGVWTRQSFQFTPINEYVISYFWPGALDKYDLANIQVERNSHPTPFVAGTRSATQALLDATGNRTIDISTMSYDSAGVFQFDGTDDFGGVGNLGSISDFTIEIVFKSDSVSNYRNPMDCNWLVYSGSYSNIGPRLEQNSSGNLGWVVGDSSGSYTGITVVSSGLNGAVYHHVALTRTGSTFISYYNGSPVTTTTFNNWYGSFSNLVFGKGFSTSGERWFIGKIPIIKIYNRVLTPDELSQNFKSYKKRFNL